MWRPGEGISGLTCLLLDIRREKLDDLINQDSAEDCGIEYDFSQGSRLNAHMVSTFGTHLNAKLGEHVQRIEHQWSRLLDDIMQDVLPDVASDAGR